MNWYLQALKKYAQFSGRARRKEYWFFVLFTVIVTLVLMMVDGSLSEPSGIGWLSSLYGLGTFLPGLGVTVRRLHDLGRSGWWVLISFLPVLGGIILLVLMALDGQQGGNQYGPDPKAA